MPTAPLNRSTSRSALSRSATSSATMRRSLTLEGVGLVLVASNIASSEKDAGNTLRYLDFIYGFAIAVSNIAAGGTRFKPKAAEVLGSLRGNLERAAGKSGSNSTTQIK